MRARSALALGAVALSVRLLLLAWAPRVPTADGLSYHGYAQTLVLGMGYVNPDGSPAIVWMPGWPLLLAGLYRLFGLEPAVGMVAAALFGAVTAPGVAALGSLLLGARVGVLAGALYAVWPGLVYYSATLYCENLFNALLVATLLLLVCGARAERRRGLWFAAAGLGFGLAAQVKAEPLALSPLLLAFLWSVRRDGSDFARAAVAVFAVCGAVMAPWIVRNQLAFDRFLPTTASGGAVAWIGNRPSASGGFDYAADLYWAGLHARANRALSELARGEAGWQEAWRFARYNPREELRILGRKLTLTYASDAEGAALVRGVGGREHWQLPERSWRRMAWLADAFWYALLGLAAIGLTTLPGWPREARILILGLILSWLAVHLVFIGGPRFRVPEAPAWALLAACGAERLARAARRLAARRASALAALLLAAGLSGCGPAPPRNLLLIVVDTLRADHLGGYGYARDTSPSLDALAAAGVRFERAYSPASWTKPAMASLLTGLYPSGHGVTDVQSPLPAQLRPLAVRLAEHGYRTAGVVSNVQLSNADESGMGRGFERYVEIAGGPGDVSTPAVTEQAIAALRALSGGEAPFFLLAHYFDPHADYRRHQQIGFAAERAGRLDGRQSIEELQNRLLGSLDAAEVGFLRDLYDEEIRFTDAGIGRLLGALHELGRTDDTLVVVTADHGEEFLEHGWLGHVRSLYEELIRVPLIVRDPDAVDVPRVVQTPVSLVSLAPTVLELLHVESGGGFEAPSLAAVIRRGGEPADAPVYAEVSYVPLVLPHSKQRTFKKAVLTGGFKLVEDGESGRRELYHLRGDPAESADLAGARPELAGELASLLARFAARGEADAGRRELSEAEREQLRQLGYLGP